MESEDEIILCAAIWYKDFDNKGVPHQPNNIDNGIVVSGWRHGSIIALTKAMTGLRSVQFGDNAIGESVQGFLTSKNRFIDRKEAHGLFVKNGGIPEFKELYSEDLY